MVFCDGMQHGHRLKDVHYDHTSGTESFTHHHMSFDMHTAHLLTHLPITDVGPMALHNIT